MYHEPRIKFIQIYAPLNSGQRTYRSVEQKGGGGHAPWYNWTWVRPHRESLPMTITPWHTHKKH